MLTETLEEGRRLADAALERLLPPAAERPSIIHRAIRHSVFAGGKRLRPILAMESARLIAETLPDGLRQNVLGSGRSFRPVLRMGSARLVPDTLPEGAEELGAALEMLHTYSLIHDDLPALDNDDLRRGQPTCHKVFGEAIAILAGDALQTRAYEVLSRLRCPADGRVRIIEEVARATGTVEGMIGGQVMDLEAEHTQADAQTLEYIHRSKTAALITASVVSGGVYAGGSDVELDKLRQFGRAVGVAFQIADDVLDLTQSSEQLGKTAGKDAAREKVTYPALFGIEESLRKAESLVDSGCAALDSFGPRAETLKALARFLVERKK